jgi:ribosome-associated toxin RatA of RatAB toxin-antitoxin module
MNNIDNYNNQLPVVNSPMAEERTNSIINARDIDYIEKKDLLTNFASAVVRNAQDRAIYVDALKQEIAKQ